jgi:hypothetical protein
MYRDSRAGPDDRHAHGYERHVETTNSSNASRQPKLAFESKLFERSQAYEPSNWHISLCALAGRPIPPVPFAVAVVWCTIVITTNELWEHDMSDYFHVPWAYLTLYSSTLVFLLAFRLNVANARWWEARCLWGAQIARSWQLISTMTSCCKDYDTCEIIARWTVAFSVTTKDGLRGTPGKTEELRQVLSTANLSLLENLKMKPLRCMIMIKMCIKRAYENGLMLPHATWMVSANHITVCLIVRWEFGLCASNICTMLGTQSDRGRAGHLLRRRIAYSLHATPLRVLYSLACNHLHVYNHTPFRPCVVQKWCH